MPKTIVLNIPTINNDFADYNTLFELWNRIANKSELSVTFDFQRCRFLRSNAVAFLAGLVSLIEYNGGEVTLKYETISENVCVNLAQNGFLAHCGFDVAEWEGNSVPLRQDMSLDSRIDFFSYLKSRWIGTGWVNCSTQLRNLIAEKVLEVYLNAFEHAFSPVGTFTCGQHYPQLNELELTFVDFGIGIPKNVKTYLQQPNLEGHKTLRWAFLDGNSTKADEGDARGLGLGILSDFIRVNSGAIQIFSEKCWGRINNKGDFFGPLHTSSFTGTLVTITIKCDDSYYVLRNE